MVKINGNKSRLVRTGNASAWQQIVTKTLQEKLGIKSCFVSLWRLNSCVLSGRAKLIQAPVPLKDPILHSGKLQVNYIAKK